MSNALSRVRKLLAPTRDTHTDWTTNNPVVAEGVLGLTKGRLHALSQEFFAGDGVRTYSQLVHSLNAVGSSIPPYDADVDYTAGMLVCSSGKIYMCTAANGPGSTVAAVTNSLYWAELILTAASSSADGYMSATDKAKLDGITAGANAYVHPSYDARTGKPTGALTPGFGDAITVSQITSDALGHVTAATDRSITIPDTAMGAASANAAGTKGLVPAPAAGDQAKVLLGDGTWGDRVTLDTQQTLTAIKKITGNNKGWSVTNNTHTMEFKIGAAGTNRGIWDVSSNKWIFHTDGTDCFVGGSKVVPITNAINATLFSFDSAYVSQKAGHLFQSANKIAGVLAGIEIGTNVFANTYTTYVIGQLDPAPKVTVRTVAVNQTNGVCVPILVRATSGNVELEVKSIKPSATWLWFGFVYPIN